MAEKTIPKKYAIKPPRDLTSRFELEQEEKRLQEIKDLEEKRLREEEERLLVGLNGPALWRGWSQYPQGLTC